MRRSRPGRDFRLLPLVLLAAVALLVLKSAGLVLDGGYLLGPSAAKDVRLAQAPDIVGSIPESARRPAVPDTPLVTAPVVVGPRPEPVPAKRQSWAQEMLNYPDITGSVGAKKEEPAAGAKPAAASKAGAPKEAAPQADPAKPGAMPPQGVPTLGMPNTRPVSPAERAILERLQERRKDLEVRARELDMREGLLKATEKKLESRVKGIRQPAEGPASEGDAKGEPPREPQTVEENAARLKGLVTMYENMKAKDAARIFDRLDLRVLAELASRINPRQMGDILANMSPEAAERLTIEFASRGHAARSPSPADLPKIEGRPTPKR